MEVALGLFGIADLTIFFVAAILGVLAWRRRRTAAAGWAALVFVALALAFDLGPAVGAHPHGWQLVLQRFTLSFLLVVPYLLYRFTCSFEPSVRRGGRRVALAATIAVVVWIAAVPHWPQEGEKWPAWAIPFLVFALGLWLVLACLVVVRLWRGGGGRPTIARRRMRWLALASGTLTAAVTASIGFPGDVRELLVEIFAGAAAVAFFVALFPPPILRTVWRRREQERFYDIVGDLVSASDSEQLLAAALPAMAAMVGAEGIALFRDDELVGSAGEAEPATVIVQLPDGELQVRTSAYAPYFGDEELALLRTVGSLTLLAAERARTLEHEREVRRALERADELKTTFVALAAHELRGPVGTADGIVKTLERHEERLDAQQRSELRAQLGRQTGRLVLLVEQLLDLSRLDADAIAIEPRPVPVRLLVEDLVASTAGGADVELDVDPALEVVADPDVIDRVVSNLVGNALKYGEPPVSIAAVHADGRLRIAVDDCGGGVPEELVPVLFERFTRGAGAGAETVGTGLGLAIARSYARAHGGDLRYLPAEPHGSRFELVLPARRLRARAGLEPVGG